LIVRAEMKGRARSSALSCLNMMKDEVPAGEKWKE